MVAKRNSNLFSFGSILSICFILCHSASGEETPVVYGLIIGVTNYQGASLPSKVIESAERFYAAFTNAYPNSQKRRLFDSDATLENVREALFEEIPKLPPRSLVVVYFAGHGKRVDYDRDEIPSDLFLLLNGSGLGGGYSRSAFRAEDIISAISRTRLSSAMIFFDCCFSGNDPRLIDVGESALNALGLRAFLLSSSSRAEPTLAGLFTRSLVKAWQDARASGNDCLTPRDLEIRMKKIAAEESSGYMHPELSFGRDITRCFAQLDQPSCLLAIEFTNGCKYPLQLNIGPNKDDYTPGRKPFAFFRQISRKPTLIEIYGPGNQLIYTTNLTLIDLNRDYLVLPVALPHDLAISSASDLAESRFLVAKTIENYGAQPFEIYLASATLLKEANLDNSVALSRASKLGAETLIPSLLVDNPPRQRLEIAASSSTWSECVKTLENVGKHTTAAKIMEIRLQDLKTNLIANPIGEELGFSYFSAAKNYRAAGESKDFERIVKEMQPWLLNVKQRDTLDLLKNYRPSAVRESINAFPESAEAWKALGQIK